MDNVRIKFGAIKSPSRKAIDVVHLGGFFYGGGVWEAQGNVCSDGNWLTLRVSQCRRKPTARQAPNFLQDNSLSVMISKAFPKVVISLLKKVLCCVGWNRALSTSRTRMNQQRGHHAGTAIKNNAEATLTAYDLSPITLLA